MENEGMIYIVAGVLTAAYFGARLVYDGTRPVVEGEIQSCDFSNDQNSTVKIRSDEAGDLTLRFETHENGRGGVLVPITKEKQMSLVIS